MCRVAGRRVDVGVLQVYKTVRGFCSLRVRLIPMACGDIGVPWTLIRDQLSGLHKLHSKTGHDGLLPMFHQSRGRIRFGLSFSLCLRMAV